MNRVVLSLLFFLGIVANCQEVPAPKATDSVTHVHTAMDHISILQFEDPVIKVAAGSPGFQIERDGNTVLIKPLKQNASTDLVVWTATNNRYAYELDAPGEVKNMNFAIDAPASASKIKEEANPPSTISDVADMVLIRAFLGSQRIDSSRIKGAGPLDLRIQQVFRSSQSVYIHYSLRNASNKPVKLTSLTLSELVRTQRPEVSLMGVLHTQIEEQELPGFGKVKERQLSVFRSERQNDSLQPGDVTQGVLVIRESVSSPVILQLAISADTGAAMTKATMVF